MKIKVDVHIHCEHGIEVLNLIREIKSQGERIMSLLDDLQKGIADLNKATNEVATRIDALVARLENSSLSETEKATILASLTAESDRLKTLAVDPDNPVPPVPMELKQARSK